MPRSKGACFAFVDRETIDALREQGSERDRRRAELRGDPLLLVDVATPRFRGVFLERRPEAGDE